MPFQLGASTDVGSAPSDGGNSGGGFAGALGAILRGGASYAANALQGGVSSGGGGSYGTPTDASRTPGSVQQALTGGAKPLPTPGPVPMPQFSQMNPAQPVNDPQAMLTMNGRQYPMSQLLAYSGAQGNAPPSADSMRILSDTTNATRQPEPQTPEPPSVENIQSDISKIMESAPSFTSGPVPPSPQQIAAMQQQQQVMPPQGPPGPDGTGGNATPVDYNPPPLSYSGGSIQGPAIPGRADRPQMDIAAPDFMTPELAQQMLELKRSLAYYKSVVAKGSPDIAAVDHYTNNKPHGLNKILTIMAQIGAHGGPLAPAFNGVPDTLNEYIKTPQFIRAQSAFDDAQNKILAIERDITALEKERAVKKYDLVKDMESAKVVPASVKVSILNDLGKEPAFMEGPNGEQIPNLQKLQQIDLLINEGLLPPEEREAAFRLHTLSVKTEQDRKNLEFASKMMSDAVKMKTDNLKYTKLVNSMQIDQNIKEARLAGLKMAAKLNQARLNHISVEDRQKMDSARRQIQRMEMQQIDSKRKNDGMLAKERLDYAKIAGSIPGTGFYTKEAIADAAQNVKMIDAYMTGKFSDLQDAAAAIGHPMPSNQFMNLLNSKDPSVEPLRAKISAKAKEMALAKTHQASRALLADQGAPGIGDDTNVPGDDE